MRPNYVRPNYVRPNHMRPGRTLLAAAFAAAALAGAARADDAPLSAPNKYFVNGCTALATMDDLYNCNDAWSEAKWAAEDPNVAPHIYRQAKAAVQYEAACREAAGKNADGTVYFRLSPLDFRDAAPLPADLKAAFKRLMNAQAACTDLYAGKLEAADPSTRWTVRARRALADIERIVARKF